MIFKYFSYDKKIKDWQDTKCYCTVCDKQLVGDAHEVLYKLITGRKLMSLDIANFSYTDNSVGDWRKIFELYNHVNNKRYHFGKLVQLPSKEESSQKLTFNTWDLSALRGRITSQQPPPPYDDIQPAQVFGPRGPTGIGPQPARRVNRNNDYVVAAVQGVTGIARPVEQAQEQQGYGQPATNARVFGEPIRMTFRFTNNDPIEVQPEQIHEAERPTQPRPAAHNAHNDRLEQLIGYFEDNNNNQ